MSVVWNWSIPGGITKNSVEIRSSISGASSIQIAVSTTLTGDDPNSPAYFNGTDATPEGLVTHILTGLAAGTVYYAKLSPSPGVFVGEQIKWTTLPGSGVPFSRKIALVSCQNNFTQSETNLTWQDILDWGADDVYMIGDTGYWGNTLTPSNTWQDHLAKYTSQFGGLPTMRKALARSANVNMADDHEISGDNGESNASTDTGKVRKVSILAMQNIFPMYPLADSRSPANKHGLYGSIMLGDNTRVIYLDGMSTDRSLGSDPDTSDKTFLGAPQDEWLRELLLLPAAVNIIVCSKSLLGDPEHDAATADKIPNYATWRDELVAYISTHLTTDGNPIEIDWWGGDRHANGYVSKDHNPVMVGHPALMSSGAEQHALDQHSGEDWDFSYGYNDHTLDIPVVQYVRVVVSDTPGADTGVVRIDVQSREVHDTFASGAETDPTDWVMVDGFSASDTWSYDVSEGEGGESVETYLRGSFASPVDGTIGLDPQPVLHTYRWTTPPGIPAQPATTIDPDTYSGKLPLSQIRALQFSRGSAGVFLPYGRGLVFSTTPLTVERGRINYKVEVAPESGSFTSFGVWPLTAHDPEEFYVEETTQNSDLGGTGKDWTRHAAIFAVGRGFNMYPRATYIGVGAKVDDVPAAANHYLKMVQLEMAAPGATDYPTPYTQAREVETVVEPDRLNLSENPAFAVDKEMWDASDHGGSIIRIGDGDGITGQVVIPPDSEVTIHHQVNSLVIGRRYTASFFLWAPGRSEVEFEVVGGDIAYSYTWAQSKNNKPDETLHRDFPYRRVWVVFDATSTEASINLTPNAVGA